MSYKKKYLNSRSTFTVRKHCNSGPWLNAFNDVNKKVVLSFLCVCVCVCACACARARACVRACVRHEGIILSHFYISTLSQFLPKSKLTMFDNCGPYHFVSNNGVIF